jgi:3-hydroxybutyryl-CoA dehydrogenase
MRARAPPRARARSSSSRSTGLVAKGKLDSAEAKAAIARIRPVERLDDAAGVGLVVEAIIENADAKRALFRELEAKVDERCILASNTSSISVTALANGLKAPRRFVGMHFFNPVPLMKLVEVVSGLETDPAVAQAIFELSQRWGKTPVHARSTPGFIVNRIARPYYAETLALLLERAAEPATLDACLRGGGFRMGPCELMDLIGHDTNFAVTESVFAANFFDKRYQPSLVQREMVDGGLLGRKSGRGFFAYPAAAGDPPPAFEPAAGARGRHRRAARPWRRRRTLGRAPRRGGHRLRVGSGESLERPADEQWRAAPHRRPAGGAGRRRGGRARPRAVRPGDRTQRRRSGRRDRLQRLRRRRRRMARRGGDVAAHRRLDAAAGR